MNALAKLCRSLTNEPLDFPFWFSSCGGFIFGFRVGAITFIILAGMRLGNSIILALDRYKPTTIDIQKATINGKNINVK